MDMGMRITIPKYTWGIGDNKEESTQSRGDGFYIEPRIFTIENINGM